MRAWAGSHRGALALVGLAAAHLLATLLLSGAWRFGKYPALVTALRAGAALVGLVALGWLAWERRGLLDEVGALLARHGDLARPGAGP